jgi:hypothetical protein
MTTKTTITLTLTDQQVLDLLNILWFAMHQREKLPDYETQTAAIRRHLKTTWQEQQS